ncbi:hypothetical protein LCGC14_0627890 [marine sediment metagenome]|uniref:DUF5131 family protein n=1 Tax=marine sediment metagenome TaxID=412755 RepID=A0A0F9R7Z7_9ZZZZ
MNKLIRLSPTGIEYGDYAWNFASGCGNNIDGKCNDGGFKCWAYPITQRFADRYPNGFKPTIHLDALLSPLYLKKPSRILCAFMGDLFWDCPEFDPEREIHHPMPSDKVSVTMSLKGWIYTTIKQCPQHTFLFLTKQPQNLIKFSPFPDNCWVGVTATNHLQAKKGAGYLRDIQAKIKFMSFEPLLADIGFNDTRWARANQIIKSLDWLIISSQTKPYKPPKIEWVREIVQAADKAGVKVFLKDSLRPLFRHAHIIDGFDIPDWACGDMATSYGRETLRQEMPE